MNEMINYKKRFIRMKTLNCRIDVIRHLSESDVRPATDRTWRHLGNWKFRGRARGVWWITLILWRSRTYHGRTGVALCWFQSAPSSEGGISSDPRGIHAHSRLMSVLFVECKSPYLYQDHGHCRNVVPEHSYQVSSGSHICVWTSVFAEVLLFDQRKACRTSCILPRRLGSLICSYHNLGSSRML